MMKIADAMLHIHARDILAEAYGDADHVWLEAQVSSVNLCTFHYAYKDAHALFDPD